MNRQSVNKLREMLNGQQKLGAQYVTQMYTIFLHSLPLNKGLWRMSLVPVSHINACSSESEMALVPLVTQKAL